MKLNDDFDSRLETELRRRLHGASAAVPPYPRYKAVAAGGLAGRSFRLLSGAGAAFAAKAGTGLVVAAFAVGATGTALSGSPNPAAWGTSVHQVVDQCKAGSSVEGIGGCVTAVTHEHSDTGPAAPTSHPVAPAAQSQSAPQAPPATTPGGERGDGAKSPRPTEHPEGQPTAKADKSPKPSPRPSPSHPGDDAT